MNYHPRFPHLDLPELLEREYGQPIAEAVSRLEKGHTNASFLVTGLDGRHFVLRQSWRGKPRSQILREEALLAYLQRENGRVPVPRIASTLKGQPRAVVETMGDPIVCHLFERLPGQVRYRWHDTDKLLRSDAHQRSLAGSLARLHAAAAGFRVVTGDPPLARLHARLSCIAREAHVPGYSEHDLSLFRRCAEGILTEAERLPWEASPFQACHGDFQLANLLFEDDRVSGILDFDTWMYSVRELDLAFALFSISRSHDDAGFHWHEGLWQSCLDHYRRAATEEGIPPSETFLDEPQRPVLKNLYCLDQALQHLDCACKGIWDLAEGIGFFSCYNEVLATDGGA